MVFCPSCGSLEVSRRPALAPGNLCICRTCQQEFTMPTPPPPVTDLDASIVIPTYNRAGALAPLLARLLDQDAEGVRYEVLVVDNNSTDDTKTVVQRAIDADPHGRLRYAFE